MRLVVDANVLISGVLRLGTPPGLLLVAAAEGRVELLAPETVRSEIRRILGSKLKWGPAEVQDAVDALAVDWIAETDYAPYVREVAHAIRDPDDVPVVAVAYLFGLSVVSGDRAFHPLLAPVVRALTPREAIGLLEKAGA